jgi:hypothetical protein
MKTRSALVLILLLASALTAWPARAEEGKRKVKMAWRETENAVKYDVELAESADMDPLLERRNFSGTEGSFQLRPGTYYFRVRGVDKSDAPGPWSEVQGFVVNPSAPRLVTPEDGKVFGKKLPEDGIELGWKAGIRGSEYKLQIDDKRGSVLMRTVRGTEISWMPEVPGTYKWRVGFSTATGDEWSKFRSFTVGKSAVQRDPASVPEAPARSGAEFDGKDDLNRKSEWWGIARLAQAVVAYNGQDQDLGTHSSGAELVGMYSAELRWRGGRTPASDWTYSGSLNLEIVHQSVLGTSFTLPRGYLRAFYAKESGRWRTGPFLQVGAGQSGIFLVEDPTHARRATVTRQGAGFGGVAVYRPAATLALSALAVVREDFGGNSPQLPNPLNPNLAYEAGFGVVVNVSPRAMLEGRLRLLEESFSWQPLMAGAGASSMSNTFVIFDVGVGFRF